MEAKVIKLKHSYVDGGSTTKTFKTLKGAQRWFLKQFGTSWDRGSYYIVDGYGSSKVIVIEGITLTELCGQPLDLG